MNTIASLTLIKPCLCKHAAFVPFSAAIFFSLLVYHCHCLKLLPTLVFNHFFIPRGPAGANLFLEVLWLLIANCKYLVWSISCQWFWIKGKYTYIHKLLFPKKKRLLQVRLRCSIRQLLWKIWFNVSGFSFCKKVVYKKVALNSPKSLKKNCY